jgi:hypothetical protein
MLAAPQATALFHNNKQQRHTRNFSIRRPQLETTAGRMKDQLKKKDKAPVVNI